MKILTIVLLSAILGVGIYFGIATISTSDQLLKHKEYQAEVSKIDYGLFNMHEWRKRAINVFGERLSSFEIGQETYEEVRVELEKYLKYIYKEYIATGKIFDNIIADAERNPNINKFLLKLLKENLKDQIKALDIPRYIPGLSMQLAAELRKNESRIKDVLARQLNLMIQTNDPYPYTDRRQTIFNELDVGHASDAITILKLRIAKLKSERNHYATIASFLFFLGTMLAFGFRRLIGFKIMISIITMFSIALLILGIQLPMIEIDARLNSFVFRLLDTDLSFDEQTIFYQSKSILEVTRTLIESKGIDLKVVGILILCFSVVFPLIKLILSIIYVNIRRLQHNSTVKALIFYLGKWSMADVFVVALFMAYIGFYGLVDSQLEQIESNQGGFAIETVNYSGLAPGALFFTAYCILSITIGIILNRKVSKEKTNMIVNNERM